MMRTDTKSARDPFIDNAKGLLILLVVVGHAIEPLVDRAPVLRSLFRRIYSFHMPAFVFLAGSLSKAELDVARARRLLRALVVPYLVFQLLYVLFRELVLGKTGALFVTPYWLMWFLMSLLLWRLTLPLFAAIPQRVPLAFLLGLLAGYCPDIGSAFSLSRTLVFLPFFLLGYSTRPEQLAKLCASSSVRIASLGVLALAAIATLFVPADTPMAWLYGSMGYARLGLPGWTGAGPRAATYLTACVVGLAFFALVPRRTTFLGVSGSRSLQVFLLHGFLRNLAEHLGWYAWVESAGAQILVVLLAAGVTVALSPSAVGWLLRPVLRARLPGSVAAGVPSQQ